MPPRFAEIEEKTEVWMGWFMEAFFELSTDRPAGMAPMAIPWSSMKNYADHHGFVGSHWNVFRDIIRAMAKHYLTKKDKALNNGNSQTVSEKDAGARQDGR